MDIDWLLLWESINATFANATVAAWVQALGAFLALSVAIYTSRYTLDLASARRQRAVLSVLESVNDYANEIREAISKMTDEPDSNTRLYSVYSKDVTDGYVRALQAIPLHELAEKDQVKAVLRTVVHLVLMGEALDKLMGSPSRDPYIKEALDSVGGNTMQRNEIIATAFRVSKKNVLQQLGQIDKCYRSYDSLGKVANA